MVGMDNIQHQHGMKTTTTITIHLYTYCTHPRIKGTGEKHFVFIKTKTADELSNVFALAVMYD